MSDLDEYLNVWNEHQQLHPCTDACPSTHLGFDTWVKSQNFFSDKELFEFLAGNPGVRISGGFRTKMNFWSNSGQGGFPVDYEDPALQYHYNNCSADDERNTDKPNQLWCGRCEVFMMPAQSLTTAAESAGSNEVDPSANRNLEIILERMETTLNNIDKSLAVLVERSQDVPVVLAVTYDGGTTPGLGRLLTRLRVSGYNKVKHG